jgi:DUF1009 family protein
MKKIVHPITKDLPPARLYLEDIEKIISLMKDNGLEEIKIRTQDNEFNSEEIKTIDKQEIIEEILSNKSRHLSISFKEILGKGV